MTLPRGRRRRAVDRSAGRALSRSRDASRKHLAPSADSGEGRCRVRSGSPTTDDVGETLQSMFPPRPGPRRLLELPLVLVSQIGRAAAHPIPAPPLTSLRVDEVGSWLNAHQSGRNGDKFSGATNCRHRCQSPLIAVFRGTLPLRPAKVVLNQPPWARRNWTGPRKIAHADVPAELASIRRIAHGDLEISRFARLGSTDQPFGGTHTGRFGGTHTLIFGGLHTAARSAPAASAPLTTFTGSEERTRRLDQRPSDALEAGLWSR